MPIIPEFLYDIRHPNETVLAAELAAEQAAAAAAAMAAMTTAATPPLPRCPPQGRPPDNSSEGLEYLNPPPGKHSLAAVLETSRVV